MKGNFKYFVLIAAVILVAYLYSKRTKTATDDESSQAPPPAAPPPGAPAAPTTGATTPAILASEEPAKSAIRRRAIELYNSNRREEIFATNNTRENIFSGLQYKGGVKTVLAQELPSGNADQFPIIPVMVNPQYLQRLEALKDLEGYEAMNRRGQGTLAAQIWGNALNFSEVGGPNLWPSNLRDILNAGLFFVSGPADRDKSERIDSYCVDMQKLCSNAAAAVRSAESHFIAQAIQDLNNSGWRIV